MCGIVGCVSASRSCFDASERDAILSAGERYDTWGRADSSATRSSTTLMKTGIDPTSWRQWVESNPLVAGKAVIMMRRDVRTGAEMFHWYRIHITLQNIPLSAVYTRNVTEILEDSWERQNFEIAFNACHSWLLRLTRNGYPPGCNIGWGTSWRMKVRRNIFFFL